MTTNITPREALEKIKHRASGVWSQTEAQLLAKYVTDIATQALAPQECDMNTKLDVTECSFYNDHDADVAECDEILDERYLPVHTCEERIDCTFRKYSKCKFFQNGDCGEFCARYGEEYYFGNGLQKCSDNLNCYFRQNLELKKYIKQIEDGNILLQKQLHSQQKTFTVEEIREQCNKINIEWFIDKPEITCFVHSLLAEFEKAVG